jgi:hypothetical protein
MLPLGMTETHQAVNTNDISSYEIGGVDTNDYPDFSDAYVYDVKIGTEDGERDLTEEEVDALPYEWLQETIMDSLID